mgnify:CR=1 FL=1
MFKPSKLSLAVAASAMVLSSYAGAQDGQEEAELLEEVEVFGIRASLSKAIDIKRNEIQVIESIVAEDIGKFPDNNVVEALQRVPGIQTTNRDRGEVTGLSIRGLTDITTTINGRQAYISIGRNYTLWDTPASLVGRLDILKTRSADKVASGIAGQVDIITQRPFNFDGSKFVVNARGIYSDQEGSVDPNISALASNRWETKFGDFGALLNLSYAETNWRDQSITAGAVFPYFTDAPEGEGAGRFGPGPFEPYSRIDSQYWEQGTEDGISRAPGATLNTNGYENEYMLGRDAVFANDLSGQRKRPAANLSLQWAPSDSQEYTFEAFYNGYREDVRNSMLFLNVDHTYNVDYEDEWLLYEGTNVLREHTYYDGDPRRDVWATDFNSTDVDHRQTDTAIYTLGGRWDLTDNLFVVADYVHQKSVFRNEFFAVRLLPSYYSATVNFNDGRGVPELAYHDNPATSVNEADRTDPNQYLMGPSWDNGNRDSGVSDALYIDVDWDMDFAGIKTLEFGLLAEYREIEQQNRDAFAASIDGSYLPVSEMPTDFYDTTTDFFDGRADFPDSWFIGDQDWMLDNRDFFRDLYAHGGSFELSPTFEAEETTVDGYIQATYEYEVPGGTLDGSLGFRYSTSDTDLYFYGDDAETTNSAAELLPTWVARYNFQEDWVMRLAYTETFRRPDFGALNPYTTYNQAVTSVGNSANSGNPDLEPVISANLDFSVEYYFGDGNAVYGTLFRRDIEGMIFNSKSTIMYDHPDDDPDRGMEEYILTSPQNTSNGELTGAEIGVVYFPDNLPSILDGAGIQASYTLLDSSQDLPIFGEGDQADTIVDYQTIEMYGVSNSSYSIVLAYEKETFGARLSYLWREGWRVDDDAAVFANPLSRFRRPETSLDFQFSYNVSDDFVITFDATNLTDEVFRSYYKYPDIYNYGAGIYSRTYALGVRYSY